MAMTLPPGEPAAGPWRAVPLSDLVETIYDAAGGTTRRPVVAAVDGRGAGGKSVLADRLAAAVPSSTVVHTDDIAWNHDFFDWAQLLVDGVLAPVRRGTAVSYRPPAWQRHGRPGAIDVPAGLDLVIVEGVGAGRVELDSYVDAIVWVQSDYAAAERRGIERDIGHGMNGDAAETTAFWHEWMGKELPFLAQQRPWERACVVAAGTPPIPSGADEVVLAPGPITGDRPAC